MAKRVFKAAGLILLVGVVAASIVVLVLYNSVHWTSALADWAGFPASAGDSTASATRLGLFGDSFGAINAVANAAACLGLGVAVLLQYLELKHQGVQLNTMMEMERERMDNEGERRRIDLALLVFEKWNSPEMLKARGVLRSHVEERGTLMAISAYVTTRTELGYAVIRMHAFFEEWAILLRNERIAAKEMYALLGGSYQEWKQNLLDPCWQQERDERILRTRAAIEEIGKRAEAAPAGPEL